MIYRLLPYVLMFLAKKVRTAQRNKRTTGSGRGATSRTTSSRGRRR